MSEEMTNLYGEIGIEPRYGLTGLKLDVPGSKRWNEKPETGEKSELKNRPPA